MKIRFALLFAITAAFAPIVLSQNSEDPAMPNIDEEMKKALSAKPKSAAEMKKMQEQAEAHSKRMIEENDREEAAENAKRKAAMEAALSSKKPTALPDWTPAVPQFTPSGAITRKMIDGEPRIVLSGTSPLTPEALCDAWDAFKNDHPKFGHERTGSVMNHHSDLYVTYRNSEDNSQVRMEADRKPGDKITQVTISSPLMADTK